MRRALAGPLAVFAGFLAAWQALVWLTGLPPYLLPGPRLVALALWTHRAELGAASLRTLGEILAGFGLGGAIGVGLATLMAAWSACARALRPALLFSQTIPIFALAPILTLWLGYGAAPKIVVAALITFFPVTTAFFDGLTRTPPASLDLGRVMGAGRWREMIHLRVPAALPALGTGLRLAAIYAPVGAVIGEWVGGSEGLGALMIHANGRMRVDLVFAGLALVTLITVGFHALVDRLARRAFARFG
ncbi:MAG: ABC transporter permease [Rhodovulum sulfidophilum]|uniref:ABC transporter permease n=1 Tax=Rhodovulum sulfidophilum TaxID=35806 RepID=A0A2W5NB75_RHOSU|nr:MAG: ABC transporter permease [Rhodovulum sulfidophilum]